MEPGMPQWVMWISGGIGTAIAAFVIRMGWKSGGGEKTGKQQSVSFEAGIVDSSTTMMLTAAITALVELGKEFGQEASEPGRRALETAEGMVGGVRELARQIEELRVEVQNLRREMSRKG